MVMTVDFYEAKTHLAELLERAAKGEEIVIAVAGKAMARLVPVLGVTGENPRKSGWGKDLLKGVDLDGLFDPALNKEIADEFYDGPLFPNQR